MWNSFDWQQYLPPNLPLAGLNNAYNNNNNGDNRGNGNGNNNGSNNGNNANNSGNNAGNNAGDANNANNGNNSGNPNLTNHGSHGSNALTSNSNNNNYSAASPSSSLNNQQDGPYPVGRIRSRPRASVAQMLLSSNAPSYNPSNSSLSHASNGSNGVSGHAFESSGLHFGQEPYPKPRLSNLQMSDLDALNGYSPQQDNESKQDLGESGAPVPPYLPNNPKIENIQNKISRMLASSFDENKKFMTRWALKEVTVYDKYDSGRKMTLKVNVPEPYTNLMSGVQNVMYNTGMTCVATGFFLNFFVTNCVEPNALIDLEGVDWHGWLANHLSSNKSGLFQILQYCTHLSRTAPPRTVAMNESDKRWIKLMTEPKFLLDLLLNNGFEDSIQLGLVYLPQIEQFVCNFFELRFTLDKFWFAPAVMAALSLYKSGTDFMVVEAEYRRVGGLANSPFSKGMFLLGLDGVKVRHLIWMSQVSSEFKILALKFEDVLSEMINRRFECKAEKVGLEAKQTCLNFYNKIARMPLSAAERRCGHWIEQSTQSNSKSDANMVLEAECIDDLKDLSTIGEAMMAANELDGEKLMLNTSFVLCQKAQKYELSLFFNLKCLAMHLNDPGLNEAIQLIGGKWYEQCFRSNKMCIDMNAKSNLNQMDGICGINGYGMRTFNGQNGR